MHFGSAEEQSWTLCPGIDYFLGVVSFGSISTSLTVSAQQWSVVEWDNSGIRSSPGIYRPYKANFPD